MKRHRLTIAIGLVLSVALLWWALRDVSAGEVLRHVGRADPWLLGASVIVATGTFVLRALRWRVLLLPVLDRSSFRSRFAAVSIGFGLNNLLPVRLGEFVRIYVFAREEPISLSATFASLVLERLFDGVIMLVFLLLGLWASGILGGQAPPMVRNAATVASVLVAVGLVVLWLVARHPERLADLVRKTLLRVLPGQAAHRAAGMLHSFLVGLGALRDTVVFARVLAWSAAVWLWNAVSFWLGLLAFDIRAPGLEGALVLQSVIGFAVSIPSSPGFFGPFEAGARVALSAFGVAPALIISFAVGYHVLTFLPITLIALWYAHRLGVSWAEVERSEEVVETQVEHEGEELTPRYDPG